MQTMIVVVVVLLVLVVGLLRLQIELYEPLLENYLILPSSPQARCCLGSTVKSSEKVVKCTSSRTSDEAIDYV